MSVKAAIVKQLDATWQELRRRGLPRIKWACQLRAGPSRVKTFTLAELADGAGMGR